MGAIATKLPTSSSCILVALISSGPAVCKAVIAAPCTYAQHHAKPSVENTVHAMHGDWSSKICSASLPDFTVSRNMFHGLDVRSWWWWMVQGAHPSTKNLHPRKRNPLNTTYCQDHSSLQTANALLHPPFCAWIWQFDENMFVFHFKESRLQWEYWSNAVCAPLRPPRYQMQRFLPIACCVQCFVSLSKTMLECQARCGPTGAGNAEWYNRSKHAICTFSRCNKAWYAKTVFFSFDLSCPVWSDLDTH